MIFIEGYPSMNINGYPSMNMVPVFSFWAPSFGPHGARDPVGGTHCWHPLWAPVWTPTVFWICTEAFPEPRVKKRVL